MRLLSIDFGTSNTVVALSLPGQASRTVTFDDSPLLPSAVYLAADGSVTVGRDAQRQARLDPTRFEPNPKRRIDDGEVLLGDRVVDVVDLIAAVLRTVATEVRRQLGGGAPDEVRLTHPAQWGATRQNTLLSAARKAGLGSNLVLIPEPVAAAAQYTQLPGRELPPGGSVAIYDLGGGTFDIAVVGRAGSAFQVLAEAGLADLGGLDFDQAVLEHVGRTTSSTDPGRWQQILRPADAPSRRAARALAEDVRAAKETLSRYPQTDVALPDPFRDVHLTRPEFEGLIRPNLLRSIEVLQSTLRSAGVGQERLTGIFLVGGSSRVPLVAKLISEQLGVTPVALDQPETAVALGALLVPTRTGGERTAAFGDTPGHPGSGAQPMVPHSGPHQFTGPGSGQQPISRPSMAVAYGQPLPSARSKNRQLLLGGAVVALLAVVTVVLVLVLPKSDQPVDPGGGGTSSVSTTGPSSAGPSESSGSVSSGSGSSQGSSDPTSGSATPESGGSSVSEIPLDPAGNSVGVGPDGAMTQNELDFLGPAGAKLINCGDSTATVKDRFPAEYQGQRILGCEINTDDPENKELVGRTQLFVFTMADAAASEAMMDQITADRVMDGGTDPSGTTATSQGSLRIVGATGLDKFGLTSSKDPRTALAWSIQGKPFVAVMVGVDYTPLADLVDYFELHFKPR